MSCYVNHQIVPCNSPVFLFLAIPFILIGLFFLIKPDLFIKYQMLSMKLFGKGTWQPSKWFYTFYRIFGLVFLAVGLFVLGMIILSYVNPSKDVALPTDNISLNCQQVSDQWCYNVVGGGRGCFSSKDECEYDQASSKANAQWLSAKDGLKDAVYCDNITFTNLQARCYLDLAQKLKEPAICDKIDNSEDKNKDLCYGVLGALTNNGTLCEKAKDKDYCNSEYTNAFKD